MIKVTVKTGRCQRGGKKGPCSRHQGCEIVAEGFLRAPELFFFSSCSSIFFHFCCFSEGHSKCQGLAGGAESTHPLLSSRRKLKSTQITMKGDAFGYY